MNAFVYGTLCEPDHTRRVLGHADYVSSATLTGLHRVSGRYPTLAPGGSIEGRILRLSGDDLQALDAYEGVERGLYVRVRVPFEDGAVWTYVGDPNALGVDVAWPGDGPFESRVKRYVERNDVQVRR